MSSLPSASPVEVRLLEEGDRPTLMRLLARDEARLLYLRSLVHEYGLERTEAHEHGRLFGGWCGGELRAALFYGNSSNLTSAGHARELAAVLDEAIPPSGTPRLFVGPSEHAAVVRRAFVRAGTSPFLDREQTYYELTPETLADLEPVEIRPAVPDDLEEVTAAQAGMTEEDLSIPRAQLDVGRLREMARRRIALGKVWVVMDGNRLLFKTEEAARAPEGILVGGVYTRPERRGRGLATRAMRAWARAMFAEGLQRMTLHVNAANLPAVRAYERTGFRSLASLRLMLGY